MSALLPQNNPFLSGHEEAESVFLNAWKAGALHHSWLITGVEGIGKATLSYRIARFLLSADENRRQEYTSLNVSENNPAFRLVANGSHPDLKVLERDFIEGDKKKIIKAIRSGEALNDEELQDLKKSSVIKVDEVRTINEFLNKKSFDGNWRIVIVDSADDLNTASANAILKILEEPPAKSLLLLVCHNPNRLLPTIKSRCAKLNLQPLAPDTVASLLRRYAPDLSEAAVTGIAKISSGSIGKALTYVQHDGLALYANLEKLFFAGKNFDLSLALDLSDAAAADENVWDLTVELVLKFLSDYVKGCENVQKVGEAWALTLQILNETTALNMDKRQAMLNIFSTICGAVVDVG